MLLQVTPCSDAYPGQIMQGMKPWEAQLADFEIQAQSCTLSLAGDRAHTASQPHFNIGDQHG